MSKKDKYPEFDCSSCFGPYSAPGVYGVFTSDPNSGEQDCIYIGSSKNIRERVLSPGHPYRLALDKIDDLWVITRSKICDNYREVEKELIGKYSPRLNKQHRILNV